MNNLSDGEASGPVVPGRCDWCGAPAPFRQSEAGQLRKCGRCGQETVLATPPAGAGHSRTVRAGQDRPTTRRRRPPLWWLGAAGILAGVLLAVSGGLVPGLALALGGGILCAVAR